MTLSCKASGDPLPEIDWYKDGVRVQTGSQTHRLLLGGGRLFFLRAMQTRKHDDAGIYWCVARNRFGQVRSKNATLTIAGKWSTKCEVIICKHYLLQTMKILCIVDKKVKHTDICSHCNMSPVLLFLNIFQEKKSVERNQRFISTDIMNLSRFRK